MRGVEHAEIENLFSNLPLVAGALIAVPDGQVLVAGGHVSSGAASSVELYDPVAGTWTTTDALNAARQYQTATLLANGQVLVAGGTLDGLHPLSSVEAYDRWQGADDRDLIPMALGFDLEHCEAVFLIEENDALD